ncbi:hypothetical protein [Desulfosediminicola sp.]|uniref:hypothetical protein n=1 Tax=Desulfosediminicola sp. TaxID=2886825 RepID=UPI003AF288AD
MHADTKKTIGFLTMACFMVALLCGFADVPKDDEDIKLLRFDGINGNRYSEIFLISGSPETKELKGGVYQTIGLNDPNNVGDTAPAAILDKIDMKALAEEYGIVKAYKNGPRLWTLDWPEVNVGTQRNFQGLNGGWMCRNIWGAVRIKLPIGR